MTHMLARQVVEDVAVWRTAFAGERHAQLAAGLHAKHIWQDMENAKCVYVLFKIEDVDRARAFVSAPASAEIGEKAGVAAFSYHFLQEAPV